MDVVDLRNFYAQRLGTVARRFVSRGIRARWNDTRSLRVLGIGYATPYLGLFRGEAERCLALMPALQGVVRWPSSRPALVAYGRPSQQKIEGRFPGFRETRCLLSRPGGSRAPTGVGNAGTVRSRRGGTP